MVLSGSDSNNNTFMDNFYYIRTNGNYYYDNKNPRRIIKQLT